MTPVTFNSNGLTISGELFSPSSGASSRAVVVAYGTEALNGEFGTLIRGFCSELAAKGFFALIPNYLQATGTAPGLTSVIGAAGTSGALDSWIGVLGDGIAYCQTLSGVASGRVGLVGFSLGAHLALRAAAGPTVKALVDFFGPLVVAASAVTSATAATLPALQIHHGEDDSIVVIANSVTLDGWLSGTKPSHEFFRYPHNGHPGQPGAGWGARAQTDSTERAVQFLTKTV
jgi:dienelactone hydrolase